MHTGRPTGLEGDDFDHQLSSTPQTFSVPFVGGLSVTFRLGAANYLEEGAIVKKITALRVAVERILPASISTQIAIL